MPHLWGRYSEQGFNLIGLFEIYDLCWLSPCRLNQRGVAVSALASAR